MKKDCLECGDTFIGRSDKKFCSDSCRNSYNNRLNSDENNFIRNTNNILRKNRRIIKEFIPTGKSTSVGRDKLLQKGFNFNLHTEIVITKAGKKYFFCYEYGYLQLAENKYALVKKD